MATVGGRVRQWLALQWGVVGETTPHSASAAAAPGEAPEASRLAARALAAFLATFLAARILVFLIMSRRVPDLYLHLGGTHVHHLNYGIFLLSAVGGYLLFARPSGRPLRVSAVVYGVGLALTFDEFGMWIHLGGSYWQRASYDAVVVVAAVLGLIALAPSLGRIRPRHGWAAAAVAAAVLLFGVLLRDSMRYAGERVGPRLLRMEREGPQ